MSLMPNKPVPALELDCVGDGRFLLVAEKPHISPWWCSTAACITPSVGATCPNWKRFLPIPKSAASRWSPPVPTRRTVPNRRNRAGGSQTCVSGIQPFDRERAQVGSLCLRLEGSDFHRCGGQGLFNEPRLFIVCPNRTLYWGTTSTMPFIARRRLSCGRKTNNSPP